MKTKSKLLLTMGALLAIPLACQADELEECNLKANLWYQDKIDIIEFVQRQQPDYKPNLTRLNELLGKRLEECLILDAQRKEAEMINQQNKLQATKED